MSSGSPSEAVGHAAEAQSFAALIASLNKLLLDVSDVNTFSTIAGLAALKRARSRRDQLRAPLADVVNQYERMIENQPIENIGNALQASWMVAGCAHRLSTLRTTWIQVCSEIDQKTALAITILGVYLACVSLVVSVVSIVFAML